MGRPTLVTGAVVFGLVAVLSYASVAGADDPTIVCGEVLSSQHITPTERDANISVSSHCTVLEANDVANLDRRIQEGLQSVKLIHSLPTPSTIWKFRVEVLNDYGENIEVVFTTMENMGARPSERPIFEIPPCSKLTVDIYSPFSPSSPYLASIGVQLPIMNLLGKFEFISIASTIGVLPSVIVAPSVLMSVSVVPLLQEETVSSACTNAQ
jgi:hypothetical protein